jgi:hypothetical protein
MELMSRSLKTARLIKPIFVSGSKSPGRVKIKATPQVGDVPHSGNPVSQAVGNRMAHSMAYGL